MCLRVDTEESEDSRMENTQYLQYLRVQLKIPAGVRDLKSKIANVSNKSFSGTVATVHRYIGKKKIINKHMLFYFPHSQVTKKGILSILLACLPNIMELPPGLRSEFCSSVVSSCTQFCICAVNSPVLTSRTTWQREMRVILHSSKVNFCKHLVSFEIFRYPRYTAMRAV